jgi:hypothetical protein
MSGLSSVKELLPAGIINKRYVGGYDGFFKKCFNF